MAELVLRIWGTRLIPTQSQEDSSEIYTWYTSELGEFYQLLSRSHLSCPYVKPEPSQPPSLRFFTPKTIAHIVTHRAIRVNYIPLGERSYDYFYDFYQSHKDDIDIPTFISAKMTLSN